MSLSILNNAYVTHEVISKQQTYFITTSNSCVQYVCVLKSIKINFNYILFTVH
jgi:hypothetical protein